MTNADGEINLNSVLDELSRRELIFHCPKFGTTRAEMEAMIAEDFCEVGASGRVYSREIALDVLERRVAEPPGVAWQTSNFRCRRLASGVYLLTYDLLQAGNRRSRRCTIWQRSAEGWSVVYHQGTIISGE